MILHQAVKKLQENSQELEKQHRLRTLRRILKLLLIGFFIGKDAEKRISEFTTRQDQIINSINKLLREELETIGRQVREIENSGTYLTHVDEERCVAILRSFEADLTYLGASKAFEEEFMSPKLEELKKYRQIISNYNKEFIKQRKRDYSYLFNKENLSLDEEQKDAIITDDKYNLVVAGAGSGKTEVLITRIAYLIKRKPDSVQPNRILAIAYQRKAREEIEQRLRDRYNINDVNAKTFHKLGKDILEKAGISTVTINENERPRMIKRIYRNKLKDDPDYYQVFLRYVKNLHDIEQEEDYKRKEDTLAYKRILPYTSIDNTRVKSRAEKEILDFFLTNKLNGEPVKIEYEPIITSFSDQRPRRPDFRLAKYDLFIEHWALDEKGEVPWWFNQTTADYKKNMKEKKEWFAKNARLFVETFSYEYNEDNPEKFIELLKKRVIEKLRTRHEGNFDFTPMTYEEVVEVAWGPYKDPIANEIFNFIVNAKIYDITPARIVKKLHIGEWSHKQMAFGNLAVKVYYDYEKELQKKKKIDFEDMINKAIKELHNDEDLYANVYDHILIDEYQDMSAQRYKLIKVLLERNTKCKLFCVGDDWQSIMGFAGSNLDLFVNFQKYFEDPAITKISTNYRSIKSIVDAGADIIKNNCNNQIPKVTRSHRKEVRIIKVFRSPHTKQYEDRYPKQIAEDCASRIAEYIQKGYAPIDILILSRYNFLRTIEIFVEKAREREIDIAYGNEFARGDQVRLMTVHKSKGVEAKVVFILDFVKGPYGFPCEIEDSSIYAPAREDYHRRDHTEEERRLFYVALTRAKEDVIIYTWEQSKSEFLEEVREHIVEERLNY
ncbi:MAG: UvrD-helicase domain-containing protein [Candidatus Bathyarchaeota archaeon]|nr:MAG: UvrD-helicase domain-containing protein [Candidatus Bathyarchaeota archaeon]